MVKKLNNLTRFLPFLIGGIVLLSFFLRIQSFIDGSFAYTYDVGRDLLVLRDISETLKPPLIGPTSGLQGLFYGPWWYYITFIPFSISFGDPKGVLLFMILTGVLTTFLSYRIGKKIDGVFLGIFFASLVAVSPVLVGISKQIWNPNIAPLFLSCVLFVLVFIYIELFRKRTGNKIHWFDSRQVLFFLFGFFLTLNIEAEIVYGAILFFSSVIVTGFLLRKKIIASDIVYFITGVIIILLPRILFELRHDFLMTQSVIGFLTNNSEKSFSLSMIENITNRIEILFDLWVRTLAFGNRIAGFVLAIVMILGLGVLYKRYSDIERFFLWYCVFVIFAYFLILSMFQQDIWDHYVVGVPLLFVFLFSLVINGVRKYTSPVIVVVFCIALVLLNTYDVISHFPKPNETGDVSTYKNHLTVIDYIYQHAQGRPFNTITYTPPIHDYTYRYLFKWYGQHVYGYTPSTSNVEAFYVIVEPDNELPERRGQWIRDRSVDGVNLLEKEFDGGVIVQIRKH